MNLKYVVLCSKGNQARIENVKRLKEQIPELRVIMCSLDDVFPVHISCFYVEDEYDGVVILEDDVQLCKNFKQRVEELVEKHPDEVVSMFESACSKGELKSEYRAGRNFAWNQCNYYPKKIGRILCDPRYMVPFVEWFDKRNEPWGYPIDTYISYVLGLNKIKYWMQVPFLVQHLDMASNFVGRSTKRQSRFFIDDMEELA